MFKSRSDSYFEGGDLAQWALQIGARGPRIEPTKPLARSIAVGTKPAAPRKISEPRAGDGADRGRIARVLNRGESVSVRWSDGHASQFHFQWLRDYCGCSLCRDEVSGQRLFDITTLPDELLVSDATVTRSGNLSLSFAPEGHAGVIDSLWLRSNCYDDAGRLERYSTACLWGRELTQALPTADYVEVTASRAALGRWLRMVRP